MALVTVSGQPGCRYEQVARITTQSLGFQLVTASRLNETIQQEFGTSTMPDKAFPDVVASIISQLATKNHLVLCVDGAESLIKLFPDLLRIRVIASDPVRIGNSMLDHRLDRRAAKQWLREREREIRMTRKRQLGRSAAAPQSFDLI